MGDQRDSGEPAKFWVEFGGGVVVVATFVNQLWPSDLAVGAVVCGGSIIAWSAVLWIRRARSGRPHGVSWVVRGSWLALALFVVLIGRLVQTKGASATMLLIAQGVQALTFALVVGTLVFVVANHVRPDLAPPPGRLFRRVYPSSDMLHAIWEGERIEVRVRDGDPNDLVGTWTNRVFALLRDEVAPEAADRFIKSALGSEKPRKQMTKRLAALRAIDAEYRQGQ